MPDLPLVSVLVPCFDSQETIQFALASVLAQTYANWECIVVDDGSRDGTQELLASLTDPRFRIHRFPENRGRGAARAAGLQMASGKYLAMVDADDWIFPEKLERQVQLMEREPSAALVTCAMIIVDGEERAVGVRGHRTGDDSGARLQGPFRGLSVGSVFHAPSLIRIESRDLHYDEDCRIIEDYPFLLRVLEGHHYLTCPEVLYAYREYGSSSVEKVLQSNRVVARVMRSKARRYPLQAMVGLLRLRAKNIGTRGLGVLGMHERALAHRSQPPDEALVQSYSAARSCIERVRRSLFEPVVQA